MLTFINTGVVDVTFKLPNPLNWNSQVFGVVKNDDTIGRIFVEGTPDQGRIEIVELVLTPMYFMSDGTQWIVVPAATAEVTVNQDIGSLVVTATNDATNVLLEAVVAELRSANLKLDLLIAKIIGGETNDAARNQ